MKSAAPLFVMGCIFLLIIVGVGGIMWEDVLEKREIAVLRAETGAAQARADELAAQALADEAAAQLERAQGERSLKESEGNAIEAPALAAARAVDGNTAIVGAMGKTNTLYDRLLPLGGLLFMVVLVMAGGAGGVALTVGYLWYREKKKNDGLKLVAPVAGTALDLT